MLKKKLAAAFLGVTTVFALSSQALAKDLILATDTAFVPFEFKEGDKYTGFDIDLFAAIAKEAGLTYKIQGMDFNGIVPSLQTRNVDMAIAGISITDKRKAVVDFSDPYYDSGIAIMVKTADVDKIKSLDDLKGKNVAVKTGSGPADFVKKNAPEAKLKLFPNSENMFLDLQSGGSDAIVYDTPNLQYYVKTAGNGKVAVSAILNSDDHYGIAFPKGSDLVPKVNAALKKIRENGEYDKIHAKWFGEKAAK
ncbi:glutamine ABC transporter substrate-binding protein GlnH [Pelistega europaea]|uniref:Glutamine ABC transporter substrate-binding protein GlnH n=1 Tax=Pelistega europaea TaxID=106147 RepID=A0A7Y4P758_9BURK|nr:glutamine ABC transporter substrate-binding protein GlnH [Pelistega europaea]NOL50400.1 glutamine ABC transporter substrate-binding protein GlnH [Pelistega europaea]